MSTLEETNDAEMTVESMPASVESAPVGIGSVVGRYVVVSRIGSGAMGVVYAAYDPQLDRKVALKLLKMLAVEGSAASARLQREAQALAKLDHPNVVTVHDVGMHDGRVFVAMQYVEGITVGAWMRAGDGPRPWREVLDVFIAAGQGLEAAHAAGLVHRDVKPENMMIETSGRVRVMDFGLARASVDDAPRATVSLDELAATDGSPEALDDVLTRTGAMMGTPAYMSPEQFTGEDTDARSDLFGYCVSLYEALYGERPFAAGSVSGLAMAVISGDLNDEPRGSDVPAWVRRVVVQGLAAKPSERWASIDALLTALNADPAKNRRRWAGLAGAGALAAAVGLAASGGSAEPATAPPVCQNMAAPLDGRWDAARRDAVSTALLGTDVAYAEDTAKRVVDRLDAYANAWVIEREDACNATRLRGEQSDELMDLRMACLDERLRALDAMAGVLVEADSTVVERSVQAAASLPTFTRCSDPDFLRAAVRPPEDPDLAARVQALDVRLDKAIALHKAGKIEDAIAITKDVATEVESLDYAPIRARAWSRHGMLQEKTGQAAEGEKTLRRAYFTAVEAELYDVAVEAASQLTFVVGIRLARQDDAVEWGEHAKAQELRQRDDLSPGLLNHLGLVANSAGRFDEAHDLQQGAFEGWLAELGPDHPELSTPLNNLGVVAYGRGDIEGARGYWERALEVQENTLGPHHPGVAVSLSNLAVVAGIGGHLDAARKYNERALGIWIQTLGADHPRVATTLNNLGVAEMDAGRVAEARAHFERSLEIREKALGKGHRDTGSNYENLGNVAIAEGRLDDARILMERSLEIREAAHGADHPRVAASVSGVARAALADGRYAEARDLERRAIGIYEATVGKEHPDLAASLTGLGEALTGLGNAAGALEPLERAIAIRVAADVDAARLAESRFALALALEAAPKGRGGDRIRALKLARRAADAYREAEAADPAALGRVEAWLAARG